MAILCSKVEDYNYYRAQNEGMKGSRWRPEQLLFDCMAPNFLILEVLTLLCEEALGGISAFPPSLLFPPTPSCSISNNSIKLSNRIYENTGAL